MNLDNNLVKICIHLHILNDTYKVNNYQNKVYETYQTGFTV